MKKFVSFIVGIVLLLSMSIGNTASLLPYPKFHGQTFSGAALSGGKLYTYAPGTTTPKVSYTTAGATVPNTNPVILNSNGDAVVYLDGLYDLVFKNSAGVTQWSLSSVTGIDAYKQTYEVDALYDYGSGTSFTQATIQSALTAIGTPNIVGGVVTNMITLLLRPGTWVISSNADWSAYTNVTFKIVPGAVISHGAFTVNIPNPQAGLYKIFDGAGIVSISGNTTTVYPEWWATNAVPGTTHMEGAIQAAVDSFPATGGTVKFGSTTYLIYGTASLVNRSRLTDGVKIRSNITFMGEGRGISIIRQDENCCFLFTTRLLAAVTNPANNVKNVAFYNLTFDKPAATWFEQSHLLNMESITGLTIRDCSFIGWSGDAICFGAITDVGLSTWLQSYVRNVVIENNIFDGVTKDNRQAISLQCGENISIINNYFTRTTRTNMPGAIDIEPTGFLWPLISNVNIQGNIFENIGGFAVVDLILGGAATIPARNINVLDNVFYNNTALTMFSVYGKISASQTITASGSPESIRFVGNTIDLSAATTNVLGRLFIVAGVKGVTIENNSFTAELSTVYLSSSLIGDWNPPTIMPVEDFYLKSNTFKNIVINQPLTEGMIQIVRLTNGEISNNSFIDCGNSQLGVWGNALSLRFADSSYALNLKIESNSFYNTAGFDASSRPIRMSAAHPLYPTTFSIYNNRFLGFNASAYSGLDSIYAISPSDKYPGFITLANSATPSVGGGNMFLTGGTTTITNFTIGQVNQQITIISEHAITITNGTNIFLSAHVNFVMAAKDSLTLIQKADGKWYELSRMVY